MDEVTQEQALPSGPMDPYELLKSKGGPSKEQVAVFKNQTPNGRIKIFSLDGGNRIFLMRAISMMEVSNLSKQLPANAGPEVQQRDMPLLVVSKCCVWTNTTKSTKLDADELRAGAAGLANTLYAVVEELSDYVDPSQFHLISTDL